MEWDSCEEKWWKTRGLLGQVVVEKCHEPHPCLLLKGERKGWERPWMTEKYGKERAWMTGIRREELLGGRQVCRGS